MMIKQANGLSKAEYARHRKVSKTAVTKMSQSNKLILTTDNLIDPDATDLLLKNLNNKAKIDTTPFILPEDILNPSEGFYDVPEPEKPGKNCHRFNEGVYVDASTDEYEDIIEGDVIPGIDNDIDTASAVVDVTDPGKGQLRILAQKSAFYRAQLLEYKAKLAKFKYRAEKSSYMESSEVEKVAFNCGRQIKEALLNIPKRLAPVIPPEIYEILSQEIEAVLRTVTATLQGSIQSTEISLGDPVLPVVETDTE